MLEIDARRIRVFTGYALVSKIIMGLGIKRAWRIAQLVNKTSKPVHGVNLERRHFLKQGGALLTGLSLLGMPRLQRALLLSTKEKWQIYHDKDYSFELEYPN